ncbi:EcoAI/FtnUII family type I restriction enzme subunit R [Empedobacter brevis]|uniref:EcoAI/FtnUII family type I restriction enzme subunit R n=1 Tax=Empedobacter brevis TaxID=247 RepID=UPI0028A6D5A8|nr:DEAD/DEAH box helicase family protein [Empedobacter brevis]
MRNESETRAELIDPILIEKGWGKNNSVVKREFPITLGRLLGNGKRAKIDKADYVLQYNYRNVGIVEAKAENKHYTEGVAQAKRYAEMLQVRFTYSTNGKQHYEIDMITGEEKEVDSLPTPDELWNRLFVQEQQEKPSSFDWKQKFFSLPFETNGGKWQPRYYLVNAVNNALEAVADGKQRILLTLATGTGKTAIAFHICWKLFHTRWNINHDGLRSPRILFLADRNILANQAFNSFSAFEEDALVRISPREINKRGNVPKNGSIFFTIFQTFMSGTSNTPNFGQYPKDYFDFIIIDECHRGGANEKSTWREILEYFSPAVQLGLTATPKRDVNGDTYDYFGKPVYTYSLKNGINDGFLTPFRVKQIETNIDSYIYTQDDKVLVGDVEEGREYTAIEFNKTIKMDEREKHYVTIFMEQINQKEKTIVFCASQPHALEIRNYINQIAREKNPNYCQRVTADDKELGEMYLKQFCDDEKTIPTILTTSQKLSTGVDATQVRNIILLRAVNSMIEFKQIIGRGTRLHNGKDYFTVYDYYKAYKHFSDPDWDGEPEEVIIDGDDKSPGATRVCKDCEQKPCICEKETPKPCEICGYVDCRCKDEEKKMIHIKLSDGKVRQLQFMSTVSFWDASGKPISSQQFLESLYGELPSLFHDQQKLTEIWQDISTRKKLMENLAEKGYTLEQLQEFQKIIKAENADLYDVLSYISYQSNILERKERAGLAKQRLSGYTDKQVEFIDFVLDQYVEYGVNELDDAKLSDLLTLKYHTIKDAKNELGDIPSIRNTFTSFQQYLYKL